MQIILAAPRGFCAGVNMAIESLEIALARFGPPVFVYHEIVHNRWVVEHFRARGVVFVEHLDDVPAGANLLYSAHGVSPEVRRSAEARNVATIDATCPLVTKVHREAARFAGEGYKIVLIGHRGHDEVIGTIGEAPEAIHLVGSVEDVDRLEFSGTEKLAYLTQTTLSVDDASLIIRRLKQRFPQIEGPAKEDICYATQNRQEAVRILAGQADLVLVVGSRNSSNSQRLVEIANNQDVPAYPIDGPDDIRPDWFSGEETVVITAGASAPEGLVERCVAWLRGRFQTSLRTHRVREENVRFQLPRELRG